LSLQKQLIIFTVSSIIVGFGLNIIRSFYNGSGIPLIAKEIEITNDVDEAFRILSEARVSEINLNTAENLFDKQVLFVDARAEEYLTDGIIPGAIFSDDNEILSEKIYDLIGYDKGFVVYCSDDECGSSEQLAYELQDLGFMNIFVFKGGWKEWTDAGFEIEINKHD
jgi:3-mercaptopyruvate sulfurtransferase SseA